MDNNSTLDALAGCQTTTGESLPYCVQIGYSANTFIPQCKDIESNCGTFLEVHIAHGTPYQDETVIISETLITERNVTGYHTITLPLTWMGNATKVLSAYTESKLRIGTLVYIKRTAPYCCCPPVFQSKEFELVPFSALLAHRELAHWEWMMCSVYSEPDQRHYTRECLNLTQSGVDPKLVTSVDMSGGYPSVCPYYPSCGTTLDFEIPTVDVTFNNKRTSYTFYQSDVKLETTKKSMYEIWWVVRSKVARTVMKRKGFNVTNPLCYVVKFEITPRIRRTFLILLANKAMEDETQTQTQPQAKQLMTDIFGSDDEDDNNNVQTKPSVTSA
eukprot:gene38119-47042_t